MVSSRDRNCQRRDVPRKEHRQDAAACVSLSKSTMSKTRAGLMAPPFSAWCRRRRLSSRLGFPCQPALSSFFLAAGGPGFEERPAAIKIALKRKNHPGLPRGFPHRSVAIRLKDRNLCAGDEKIKGFFNRWFSVA